MTFKTGQWTYELRLSSDIWTSGEYFDTAEQAIEKGKYEADGQPFKIGLIEKEEFVSEIDAENAINLMAQHAYDNLGEIAYDYLSSVSDEAVEKLQDKLNETIIDWQKEFELEPNFFVIVHEEVIEQEERE